MPILGGVDIHRKQLTFDWVDEQNGKWERGRIAPADRQRLAGWLTRFDGTAEVAFAFEGCTGWRYVAEEMAKAGVAAHLAEPADTAALRGRKRRAKTDLLTEPLGITAAQHLDRHRGFGCIGDLRAVAVADRSIDLERSLPEPGHSA